MTVDELVTKHRKLPEATVKRLNVPSHLREECLSAAWFALFKCATRFDSSQSNGACFRTYALYRIRGTVLDTVRDYYSKARCNTQEHAEAAYTHPMSSDDRFDLEQALSSVSFEDRDLLTRHSLDGVLVKDLAGSSKNWSSRRVKRALSNAQKAVR